ncbi:hypothetical protein BS333_06535 [Vibrio azureus]|uniref:Uncharacterized protein n=1 Tax=Vibrio azureus NBRC 104587 TaxID=1219077 RepID=U3AN04_9VIBR|nr:hypothetical protein [Vibrio azureus]AUI86066.1 hypothetical protein BS333_06535 [Vibrio azureus]GAD74677.1 hypothetical protein VAZ01S_013_00840 [Vibrio azureus NBRC 104587]
MKFKMLFLFSLIISASKSFSGEVIFSAERDCKRVEMSNGTRFTPKCKFDPEKTITPNYLKENTKFKDLSYKTKLEYNFTCESLRPLNLNFSMYDSKREKLNISVSADRIEKNQFATVNHKYEQLKVKFNRMDGLSGFQVMKPGCLMVVDSITSYPDPYSINTYIDGLNTRDNWIAFLLSSTAPSSNYITVRHTLEMTINFLKRFAQNSDDFLDRIEAEGLVSKLEQAQEELYVSCESGELNYCSQEIQRVLVIFRLEDSKVKRSKQEVKLFIEKQIRWLENNGNILDEDLKELKDIHNKL